MNIRIEVAYHANYEGEFEPYGARILDYPELQGYGHSPEEAIQDAVAFLEEHLGRQLHIVYPKPASRLGHRREDVRLEFAD